MNKYWFLSIMAFIFFSVSLVSAQQTQSPGRTGDVVAVVKITEQFRTISVVGRLQPKSRIVHRAPNDGYVRTVAVEEGDFVEEGQELFSIKRKDDVANVFKPSVVTARISGWVSEVLIQVEDEIENAEPAVVIIGTEGYVLEASISDKDAFKVGIGQDVSAQTSAGVAIRGNLVNRSQEPDYNTGLFTLTFHFPNSQRTYVGEFVVIGLPIDRAKGLFVPRNLIVRRYGKYFIWVVNEAQELEAREVVLGPTYEDLVMIDQGLKVGEKYLTSLTGREKEGTKISVPGS